jgi:hypothetical protein
VIVEDAAVAPVVVAAVADAGAVVDAAAIAVDAAAVAEDDTSHGFARVHMDRGCARARPFFFAVVVVPCALPYGAQILHGSAGQLPNRQEILLPRSL